MLLQCILICVPIPDADATDMEKEPGFLREAADVEGSSLTRSFWFGKCFQQLSEEELHDLGLSGSRLSLVTPSQTLQPSSVSSTGPGSSTISEDGDREENKLATDVRSCNLRFDMMVAVKCLNDAETSLSPNVHDIIVCPTHSLPPDRLSAILESTFLLNDCTLDWDAVAVHLETGEGEGMRSHKMLPMMTIMFQMDAWIIPSVRGSVLPLQRRSTAS